MTGTAGAAAGSRDSVLNDYSAFGACAVGPSEHTIFPKKVIPYTSLGCELRGSPVSTCAPSRAVYTKILKLDLLGLTQNLSACVNIALTTFCKLTC